MFKNKRGLLPEEIIFLLLNLVFFVVMLLFIINSTNGKAVYEQAYAKQIALLIDEAKPDTTILLDMQNALKLYGNKDRREMVKIIGSGVKVTLGVSGGRVYNFFSSANVKAEFMQIGEENGKPVYSKYLTIDVTK